MLACASLLAARGARVTSEVAEIVTFTRPVQQEMATGSWERAEPSGRPRRGGVTGRRRQRDDLDGLLVSGWSAFLWPAATWA